MKLLFPFFVLINADNLSFQLFFVKQLRKFRCIRIMFMLWLAERLLHYIFTLVTTVSSTRWSPSDFNWVTSSPFKSSASKQSLLTKHFAIGRTNSSPRESLAIIKAVTISLPRTDTWPVRWINLVRTYTEFCVCRRLLLALLQPRCTPRLRNPCWHRHKGTNEKETSRRSENVEYLKYTNRRRANAISILLTTMYMYIA